MVNGACVFEKKHGIIGPNKGYIPNFDGEDTEGPNIKSVNGVARLITGSVITVIVAIKMLICIDSSFILYVMNLHF